MNNQGSQDKEIIRQAAKEYADRKVQYLNEKMDSRANNIHNLRSRDFQAGAEWMRSEVLRLNETKEVKTNEGKSKEKILYENIEKRGGFKGVSFEQFMDSIINGNIDMRKGLESSFAAMEEYKNQPCQSQGGFTEKQMIEFAAFIDRQFYKMDQNSYILKYQDAKSKRFTYAELLQLFLEEE